MANTLETVGNDFYTPPTCDEHTTQEFTHFCEDHQTLICDECCKLSHLRCVNTTLSKKSSDVTEGQLDEMLTSLNQIKMKIEELKSSRDKAVTIVIQQATQCISDVKEFRERIIEKIYDLEKKARTVIEEAKKSREKYLHDLKSRSDYILKQVNESIEDVEFCQSTRNKRIMFMGLTKSSVAKENNERIVSDMMAEVVSFDLVFQPCKKIEELLHQVEELGHVSTTVQSTDLSSECDILKSHQNININTDWITGSTFLCSGDLVLCDFVNKKLHLYSAIFTPKYSKTLPSKPWDVCTVDDDEIAVTLPGRQKIQIVSVRPRRLRLVQLLKVDRKCFGIDCHGGMIYVTCHDDPGNGEVLVLTRDGRVQRRVGLVYGQYFFTGPYYVCISPTSNCVYVSDWTTGTITCLTQQDDVVYTYRHKHLSQPTSIYVDRQDNILVSGCSSNNIHRVDKFGTHQSILVREIDGIGEPHCLSYRENDGALVVGMLNEPACKVFWLK